jgi:hypothetical protein
MKVKQKIKKEEMGEMNNEWTRNSSQIQKQEVFA